MIKNLKLLLILFFIASCNSDTHTSSIKDNKSPLYMNKNAKIDARVTDLLSKMTLDEKISQLDMYHINHLATNGKLDKVKVDTMLNGMSTGSVHDFYPESALESNELQKYIIENSRLGIPVLFIEEALHGYQGNKGTAFPIPLALGSMWDINLMKKIGNAIGAEARSVGVTMVLGPTLGIGREPRWGRVQETYGEDPYLAARNGVMIIKGMQGDDLTADDAIVSEPKHFGIHSIPEGGKNTAPVYIGEREARTNFLYVFEKAFVEAEALGAMAAYHEWDGIPAAADPFLLKKILREEWGFKGMVISDLGAIVRQTGTHYTAENQKEAVANAISAGLDMQFYDYTHPDYQNAIKDALNDNLLTMGDIDRAVCSVLYVKFRLGLFENPYVDTTLKDKKYHSKKHQKLALESAEKSIVLLQNNKEILPIQSNVKKIAIIGELANKALLGGYSPKEVESTSIIKAFKDTDYEVDFIDISIPDNTNLEIISEKHFFTKNGTPGLVAEYFDNTKFSGNPVLIQVEKNLANYWHNLSPAPGVPSDNFSVRWTGYIVPPLDGTYEFGIQGDDFLKFYLEDELFIESSTEETKAKMVSKKIYLKKGKKYKLKFEHIETKDIASASLYWHITADKGQENAIFKTAIKAAENADLAILVLGEKDEHGEGKDKTDLRLNTASRQLINNLTKIETPKILILQNGRPLVLSDVSPKVDAIVETWYTGEFSGKAIVNILTGKTNPSGKLPISFPRSNGQLPIYYNQKKSSRGSYVDNTNTPLFAFGHGLSYSNYKYKNLIIEKTELEKNEIQTITVDIQNTSDFTGSEIVQLYINDVYSSIATPIMQLRGFKRVTLKPGESKNISFKLTPEDLSLWNRDMKRVVESGKFEIMIGAASNDIRLKSSFHVK